MSRKGTFQRLRRPRVAAILALGVALGVAISATPASGHITSSVTHVRDHMKQFFYTKAQSNARFVNVDEVAGGDATGIHANLQLVPDAVGAAELAPNAAGASEIGADAVRASELGPIIQRSVVSASIAAGGNGSATATCQAGEQVVGGGNDGFFDLYVVASRASGNGWAVFVHNASSGARTVTAHAYCLQG